MEKEKLREIVKKSVEEVWYNRRSMNPVKDQTELLTEALHQAFSMSGVVGRSELLNAFLDYSDKLYWAENEVTDRRQVIEQFLKSIQ